MTFGYNMVNLGLVCSKMSKNINKYVYLHKVEVNNMPLWENSPCPKWTPC